MNQDSTTHDQKQRTRRRAASRTEQSGFGLLEAIIGMVMVALLIGAGATGLQTLQSTSSGTNQVARLDALLVGAGQAVKRTPYVDCPAPVQYDQVVQAQDDARSDDEKIVQATASGTPSLESTFCQASR